ncbi:MULTISPECIES: hypothetical protein [unclassified Kitasatospora]|uniref:hypothetical protein n=1 Tax=unclassified Kitasatospora TaxID=2633591 RepID=UPI0033CEF0EA
MTAAQRRRLAAVFASAGILLGTAACSSSPGGPPGSGSVSYDGVRSVARQLHQDQQNSCPFGLDLAKALKAAEIPGSVGPDTADGPAADGSVSDGTSPQPWPSGMSHPPSMPSVPAVPPNADVTCGYRVGETRIGIELLAIPQYGAVNLLLPRIQVAARIGAAQVRQFATEQPDAGQAKLVPGEGTAAVARIRPRGAGDIALLLSQDVGDGGPDRAFTGEPLRKAAQALADQLG